MGVAEVDVAVGVFRRRCHSAKNTTRIRPTESGATVNKMIPERVTKVVPLSGVVDISSGHEQAEGWVLRPQT